MQLEDPINIGGKDYNLEDLPDVTHSILQHIINIDKQLDVFDTQMAVLKMARAGFHNQLIILVKDHEQAEERRFQENADA